MNKEVEQMFDQIKTSILNSESIHLTKKFLVSSGFKNVKVNNDLTFTGVIDGKKIDKIKINNIIIKKNAELVVDLEYL